MGSFRLVFSPTRIGDIGGVESHTLHLANEISAMGNDVSIVCSREPAGSLQSLSKKVKLVQLSTLFKIENTNITPVLPFFLLKENPDIFHTMIPTPWSADWNGLIAKLKGKKFIVTVHNDLFAKSFLGNILTRLYVETFYRILLFLADKIIIVNPDFSKSFFHTRHVLKHFSRKIISIPNGVNTEIFRPEKNSKNFNILFVSILDEFHDFKGLDYLLEAVRILKKEIPAIRLSVVGEGALKQKYINLAKSLGISEKVVFLGKKSNNSLPKIYNENSLFVLPSIGTEAFGIVLLEAMACGVPVITTEFAGMKEKIEKENCGIIVKSRDSKALAKAIFSALKDNALLEKMSKNARKLVEKEFSWKKIGIETEKVYSELLKT